MGYNQLIYGVYWGYNPFTNHVLTSWDIQVLFHFSSLLEGGKTCTTSLRCTPSLEGVHSFRKLPARVTPENWWLVSTIRLPFWEDTPFTTGASQISRGVSITFSLLVPFLAYFQGRLLLVLLPAGVFPASEQPSRFVKKPKKREGSSKPVPPCFRGCVSFGVV